jgi:hypothetical protein
LQVVGLIAGSGGLLWGLVLLEIEPLVAVLGMLAAMALLLGSLSKLCHDSTTE